MYKNKSQLDDDKITNFFPYHRCFCNLFNVIMNDNKAVDY